MFVVFNNADGLPSAWDDMTEDNMFLRSNELIRLEILNPCSQTYHLDIENSISFVCYKLNLDLFTYSDKISFKVQVNIIGIPMSVSKCGYHAIGTEALKRFSLYIKSLKGLYIVLNSSDQLDLSQGETLPECITSVNWRSMEEYFSILRSNYRYRLKKAVSKFSHVEIEELSNNCSFNKDMYNLYEEVYTNSKSKLEKLDIKFFKYYPSKIFKFNLDKQVVAFIQIVENGDELIFLFGGFDHKFNKKYDLYINMLLKIIDYGTEKQFKYINFGQTSEDTKLKLGSKLNLKYMYVNHSSPIINAVIGVFISKFSYKGYNKIHRVFKEQEVE